MPATRQRRGHLLQAAATMQGHVTCVVHVHACGCTRLLLAFRAVLWAQCPQRDAAQKMGTQCHQHVEAAVVCVLCGGLELLGSAGGTLEVD